VILYSSFHINGHNFLNIGARHVKFGSELDEKYAYIYSSRHSTVTGVASARKCDGTSDNCNI